MRARVEVVYLGVSNFSAQVEPLIAFVNDQSRLLRNDGLVVSSLKPFYCKSKSAVVVLRSSVHVESRYTTRLVTT